MSHPLVVHYKVKEYDVYIGRPSKWGNPFVLGKDGTREQVIAKFRAWFLQQPVLVAELRELRGKTLGCWCAPLACHGDVLAELANISSKCCEAGVRVEGRTTRFYVCEKCGKACDPV